MIERVRENRGANKRDVFPAIAHPPNCWLIRDALTRLDLQKRRLNSLAIAPQFVVTDLLNASDEATKSAEERFEVR